MAAALMSARYIAKSTNAYLPGQDELAPRLKAGGGVVVDGDGWSIVSLHGRGRGALSGVGAGAWPTINSGSNLVGQAFQNDDRFTYNGADGQFTDGTTPKDVHAGDILVLVDAANPTDSASWVIVHGEGADTDTNFANSSIVNPDAGTGRFHDMNGGDFYIDMQGLHTSGGSFIIENGTDVVFNLLTANAAQALSVLTPVGTAFAVKGDGEIQLGAMLGATFQATGIGGGISEADFLLAINGDDVRKIAVTDLGLSDTNVTSSSTTNPNAGVARNHDMVGGDLSFSNVGNAVTTIGPGGSWQVNTTGGSIQLNAAGAFDLGAAIAGNGLLATGVGGGVSEVDHLLAVNGSEVRKIAVGDLGIAGTDTRRENRSAQSVKLAAGTVALPANIANDATVRIKPEGGPILTVPAGDFTITATTATIDAVWIAAIPDNGAVTVFFEEDVTV